MQPIQLFELASRQAHWLSVRQSVVAGNIANANTPGYAAKDVQPFEAVLESMGTSRSASVVGAAASALASLADRQPVGVTSTGGDVSLETELMKAGEVRRDYQLNTGLVKSFHRMMMLTVRP